MIRSGIPLWTPWDPVHLEQEAYKELEDAIVSVDGSSGDGSDCASNSSLGASEFGFKRRRLEAVITTPSGPLSKRGKAGWETKPAGWLPGKPERDQARGRQRLGSYHSGQPAERGRWPQADWGWGWPGPRDPEKRDYQRW